MSDISADLTVLRSSTSDLVAGLAAEKWSDRDVAVPSLLPGWTRGHVLTHIARNADSVARTLSGALIGEVVARYPGGPAGRAADIEAGADRPMTELVDDVTTSADKLDRVLAAVHEADGWNLVTDKEWPAWHWLHARLDEVEIHRVDLAGAYTADRWPAALVIRDLPRLAETLPERAVEPVRVVVDADGSLAPDHVGATWSVGDGAAAEVRGPDWAVLAWLVGRPSAALGRLTATPELCPWM